MQGYNLGTYVMYMFNRILLNPDRLATKIWFYQTLILWCIISTLSLLPCCLDRASEIVESWDWRKSFVSYDDSWGWGMTTSDTITRSSNYFSRQRKRIIFEYLLTIIIKWPILSIIAIIPLVLTTLTPFVYLLYSVAHKRFIPNERRYDGRTGHTRLEKQIVKIEIMFGMFSHLSQRQLGKTTKNQSLIAKRLFSFIIDGTPLTHSNDIDDGNQSKQKNRMTNCPGKHGLTQFVEYRVNRARYTCNACGKSQFKVDKDDNAMYKCSRGNRCFFILCKACLDEAKEWKETIKANRKGILCCKSNSSQILNAENKDSEDDKKEFEPEESKRTIDGYSQKMNTMILQSDEEQRFRVLFANYFIYRYFSGFISSRTSNQQNLVDKFQSLDCKANDTNNWWQDVDIEQIIRHMESPTLWQGLFFICCLFVLLCFVL